MPRDDHDRELDNRKEGTFHNAPTLPAFAPAGTIARTAGPARVKFKLRHPPRLVQCPRCEGTGIESGTTLGCRLCGGGGEVGSE